MCCWTGRQALWRVTPSAQAQQLQSCPPGPQGAEASKRAAAKQALLATIERELANLQVRCAALCCAALRWCTAMHLCQATL